MPREQPINHVLACVDRSVLSESCVPHALFLSKTFGAKVTFLYVLEPPSGVVGLPAAEALGWEIARHEAQAYLDRLRETASAAGVNAETMIAEGLPSVSIVAAARSSNADVIVLGSHGEGARMTSPLGSTVAQVLATTRGSVLVARSTPHVNVAEFAPRTLLVPLDGSTRAECVIPSTVRIAKAHEATILLLHVILEPIATSILTAGENLEHARGLARRLEVSAQRYLNQLQTRLAHEHTPVRALVLRSPDQRRAIVETAEREGVDLIVASAHGATANMARSLGTVSNYLVTLAHTPLLVLQDLPQPALAASEPDEEQFAEPLRGTIHAGPTGAS